MPGKIGVITTGGTIGSILAGDAMAVDPAGVVVRRQIDRLCEAQDFEVEIRAAFNKNSEDIVPGDWAALINAVNDMLEAGIDRIVVTHGTDTLCYSAAALGLVFADCGARICLTGSFHALDANCSDGPLSLMAAFNAVANDQTPPGVMVAFRADSTNKEAVIISALDLKPMAFDGLFFDSVNQRYIAKYGQEAGYRSLAAEAGPARPEFKRRSWDGPELAAAARHIVYLNVYPGLSFDGLDAAKVLLVIVGLYHSGTACAQAGEGSLIDFLNSERGETPVLCATYPAMHIATPYESTQRLRQAGGHVVKDLQVHVVYVFAVLALAGGMSARDVVKELTPWLYLA